MLTVIVYVRVTPSPAVTLVTPSLLVTDRLAFAAMTVFESVAVLLAVFESVVVALTAGGVTLLARRRRGRHGVER